MRFGDASPSNRCSALVEFAPFAASEACLCAVKDRLLEDRLVEERWVDVLVVVAVARPCPFSAVRRGFALSVVPLEVLLLAGTGGGTRWALVLERKPRMVLWVGFFFFVVVAVFFFFPAAAFFAFCRGSILTAAI